MSSLDPTSGMRIATWNCNGPAATRKPESAAAGFRRYLSLTAPLRADILVLQEAPDPGPQSTGEHSVFWHGSSPARGIAVVLNDRKFAGATTVEATRSSLLVRIEEPRPLHVLAVWSCPPKKSFQDYLLETRSVLERHQQRLRDVPSIILGDFNSSTRWDSRTRRFSHSELMDDLAGSFGLYSAYHNFYLLSPGQEAHPTFYHRRNVRKPFHLDYCFLPGAWELARATVGSPFEWLEWSDHCPLIVDCGNPLEAREGAVPLTQDVEIGIRQGRAVTFHLQSSAGRWCHGDDAALDFIELDGSLTYSGCYDILTCSCGAALCSCEGSRRRGVEVTFLADGDCLWHDLDRDLFHRFSRRRLREQLWGLRDRFQTLVREIPSEEMVDPNSFVRPYRNGKYLEITVPTPIEELIISAEREFRSEYLSPPEPGPSESASCALTLFPDLVNGDVRHEIEGFCRWIDHERLWPLGSSFVSFIDGLKVALPQVVDLPFRERIILVLAAAIHHHTDPRFSLKGFRKLRSIVGTVGTVWSCLWSVRLPGPFDPTTLPETSEVRLSLIGCLLRLGELLDVCHHSPHDPIPLEYFESEEVLMEPDDPTQPWSYAEIPEDRESPLEFWKRAYTTGVRRTEEGDLLLSFILPEERAAEHLTKLVEPRVQEVEGLLDHLRSELVPDGIPVGRLRFEVHCGDVPCMVGEV